MSVESSSTAVPVRRLVTTHDSQLETKQDTHDTGSTSTSSTSSSPVSDTDSSSQPLAHSFASLTTWASQIYSPRSSLRSQIYSSRLLSLLIGFLVSFAVAMLAHYLYRNGLRSWRAAAPLANISLPHAQQYISAQTFATRAQASPTESRKADQMTTQDQTPDAPMSLTTINQFPALDMMMRDFFGPSFFDDPFFRSPLGSLSPLMPFRPALNVSKPLSRGFWNWDAELANPLKLVELQEHDNEYTMKLKVAVDKKDLHVKILPTTGAGGAPQYQLHVFGEVHKESDKRGSHVVTEQSFHRATTLPASIDRDKIEVDFDSEHHLLSIHMPKRAEAQIAAKPSDELEIKELSHTAGESSTTISDKPASSSSAQHGQQKNDSVSGSSSTTSKKSSSSTEQPAQR